MALRSDLAIIRDWVQPGARVLDLGCGDGTLLQNLQETRRCSGYGIEIDPDNITRCIRAGVRVIQTDLNAGLSDFEDDTFDFVVMTQTLQAVRFPEQLLREMMRVGRQGIVTFPNFAHIRCRWQVALAGKMPQTRAFPEPWHTSPNIHLCSLTDFENLCRSLDIKVLQRTVVDDNHKSNALMRMLPNLFGEIALYRFENRA